MKPLQQQILEILQDHSESFINIDHAGPDKKVCRQVRDEIMQAIQVDVARKPKSQIRSPVLRAVVDCIVDRGNFTKKQVERAILEYGKMGSVGEDAVWGFVGPAIDKIEDEVVGQ